MLDKTGDKLPFIEELLKAGRKLREEDYEPDLFSYSDHLVRVFFDISQWRGAGFSGPAPLSLSDLDAFSKYYKVSFSTFEIRMLKMMDNLYLNMYHEVRK